MAISMVSHLQIDCLGWVAWMAGIANMLFVESYMPGDYVKYTNNGAWVSTKDASRSMMAFSHFTWAQSRGTMMVTDLQVFSSHPIIVCECTTKFN
jgi:hypothetical protein